MNFNKYPLISISISLSLIVLIASFLFSQKVIVPNLSNLNQIRPETQLAQVAPTSGLVAHWKFDGNTNDSAGTNNGSLVGGPTFTTGKVSQALSFDGVDDYVEVPYQASIAPQQLTFSTWVKANSFANTDWNSAIGNQGRHEWSDGYYGLAVDTSGLVIALLNIGDGSTNAFYLSSPSALSTGAWHHLAMTYENSTLRLYVNGSEVNNRTIGRIRTQSNLPLRIGQRGDAGYFFNGQIDDVRIYNRALSAQEVLDIYNLAGSVTSTSSPTPTPTPMPTPTPTTVTPTATGAVKAFPGAEGFGTNTVGGRGGRVIHVTNLNDSGSGSFRDAVTQTGPRIVVFDVSGTITLQTPITIYGESMSYLTIAGQTSPGGIQIKGPQNNSDYYCALCIGSGAHDLVIRFLRGRAGGPQPQNVEGALVSDPAAAAQNLGVFRPHIENSDLGR